MRSILFIIFFFSIAFSQAQSFNAGLQFGMTGTQVTGDQLSGFNKAGLFGGAFVNHSAGRLGDFQLELNFIQKGSRKNAHPDKGDNKSYLMRLNYVALPVFYKFKIKKTLSIELGVEFAYLINSKEFEDKVLMTFQGLADFKKYDLSGFAGLGVNFKSNFRFVFRYSYSILPIRPKPNSGAITYYDAGQFNEVLIASIQYQF